MRNPFYLAKRSVQVIREDGWESFKYRAKNTLKKSKPQVRDPILDIYIYDHEPHEEELESQREESEGFAIKPVFSVVVPLFKTKPVYLIELLDSIRVQSYPYFEICLADAGRRFGGPNLHSVVKKYQAKYPDCKILYKPLDSNYGIAGNTNEAIKMATGDVIVFCDHDDTIAPFSFYEFAKAINEDPDTQVLYSDQDFLSADGLVRTDALWKPEFSIDFLRSGNYISHLFAVTKELLDEVGYLDPDFDGSQDFDITFRLCEKTDKIVHIPKLLYHWRIIPTSTAKAPETKNYAFENGRRAIEAHYKRVGIPARVEFTSHIGRYKTVYEWGEEPFVSVIIPNKDHVSDLSTCVETLEELSDYKNYEILIVENNSTEQETFDYYKQLQEKFDNVRVITYEGGFNYSAINNLGVREAKGDYVLLLNNDTKVMDGSLIREMIGPLMRDDVGAVGAKLFYGDNTIQHAGVVLGFGGSAAHIFHAQPKDGIGNMGRLVSVVNYSAVTGACMMTKKSVFNEVGGLNEELAVAFNDIDYCLKLREKGYFVLYTPYAKAWHYESKSRGYEDTPERMERFSHERDIFREKWLDKIEGGDPYYNPNLSLIDPSFAIKNPHEWPGYVPVQSDESAESEEA